MKKRISNVILALALTICTVFSAILLPSVQTKAANPGYDYEPKLSVKSGVEKTETVLTVGMELEPGAMILNGLDVSIRFQEKDMTYQVGTINVLQPILKNSSTGNYAVHYNGNGEIRFVWTGTGTQKLPASFDVMSVGFQVKAGAAEGNIPFQVEINSCYQTTVDSNGVNFHPLDNASGQTYKTVNFQVKTQAAVVKAVEDLISAIGTVEYTQESKTKIDLAQQAYNNLTTEQKALVSNYATLVSAQDTYKALQQQNTPLDEVEKAVQKYKEDHKEALALTSKDISAATPEQQEEILTLITDALNDYDKQLPAVQAELHRYKVTLKNLDALLADIKAQVKQDEYKQEAEELIKTFKQTYEYVLSRDPETITIVDELSVSDAWTAFESSCMLPNIGIYFKEGMVEEEKLLKALVDKMTELKKEANPEIAEEVARAEQWKADFGWLLTLKPEDLTYEDTVDVRLAKLLLDSYDEKTQALLERERVIIDELYDAALGIYPESGEVIYEEVETEPTVIEKIVNKIIGRDIQLQINNKKISSLVWYLILIALVMAALFAVLRSYYYFKVVRGGRKREK